MSETNIAAIFRVSFTAIPQQTQGRRNYELNYTPIRGVMGSCDALVFAERFYSCAPFAFRPSEPATGVRRTAASRTI